MTKKDLMNGDIVVLRSGLVGVVIINNDTSYLMFQTGGWEDLDFYYDDDMVYLYPDDDEEPEAIMQVYRTSCGFGFSDYTDNLQLYERDCTWVKPTEEEMAKRIDELKAAHIEEKEEAQKRAEESKNKRISVVAQHFYGNKTKTEINTDEIDYFLLGILDSKDFRNGDRKVDRKIVKVPGSDYVVIVYDQNQENEYVNVKFPEFYAKEGVEYKERCGEELKMQVSCEIPELNFKIHTRCFACRMNEKGELRSLKDGDSKCFIKYFA